MRQSRLGGASTRLWATLAFATVVALAVLIVASQPVRSPWWTYADADATYAGSALNLMLGQPVSYVDHPGLPLTEATAVLFGVDALIEQKSLSDRARLEYVDGQLLNLDRARGVFRGIAIAIYLLGAVLAFVLSRRLLGHWTWGFAGGLLWIAAPGLAAMSIQLRPDMPLALLTLVFAYLIGRAVENRSASLYGLAALTVGFTVMVKLHGLALLVPLAVATLWRPPHREETARIWLDVAALIRRRRIYIVAGASVWLALAILLNWNKFPFTPTGSQLAVIAILGAVTGGYALAELLAGRLDSAGATGLFERLPAFLVLAFVSGLLLPVTLDLEDGLRALVSMTNNLRGEGVQSGVEPFSTPLSALDDLVGGPAIVFFLIAALAGVVGLVRGDPKPVVWAVGALAAGAFAYARPPNVHYFAPAFVLCIPAVLWLLQRGLRTPASLLVWPIVLYIVWPAYEHRLAPRAEADRFEHLVAPAKAYVEPRLKTGEVSLVPSNWPFADSRYFELVQINVEYSPSYPYRYLPTTAAARSYAAERSLRPRYFIGLEASDLVGTQTAALGAFGSYAIRPAQGGKLVAEIVSGPGDSP